MLQKAKPSLRKWFSLQPMFARLSLCLCGLLTGLGCGPVQSTALLVDANKHVEEARRAGAEERAPYEWTSANLYLQKAREEVGHSAYETAVQLARKASQYAQEAKARAEVESGNRGGQAPE